MEEKQSEKEILFLEPVCTHNIWGGTKLRTEFGCTEEGEDIGECWGISAHPNGDGTVKNGRFAGMKLSKVWEQHPEVFGNLNYDRFPIMAKIIDAKEDLSIQVHPGDAYAAEHESGSFGKTESWYILDCGPDASLIVGHNAKDRAELTSMIREGKWSELIREVPVKKGDFIQIDPGTVHAIKGGIVLLETQQSSDITYRVYDYDRLWNGKPRDLHVQKSIDVITVPAKPVKDSVTSMSDLPKNRLNRLYTCRYYDIFKADVEGGLEFWQKWPFLAVSVVEGDGAICGRPIKKGTHLILPDGFGMVEIEGTLTFIASAVCR